MASGDERVPLALVEPAHRIYEDLCATQRNPALLHGDLHDYNVLSDRARGWCAIHPKGVVGELEYQLGASLRNPIDRPDLFAKLDIVERRLDQFGLVLGVDVGARAAGVSREPCCRRSGASRKAARTKSKRRSRSRACCSTRTRSGATFSIDLHPGANTTQRVICLAHNARAAAPRKKPYRSAGVDNVFGDPRSDKAVNAVPTPRSR